MMQKIFSLGLALALLSSGFGVQVQAQGLKRRTISADKVASLPPCFMKLGSSKVPNIEEVRENSPCKDSEGRVLHYKGGCNQKNNTAPLDFNKCFESRPYKIIAKGKERRGVLRPVGEDSDDDTSLNVAPSVKESTNIEKTGAPVHEGSVDSAQGQEKEKASGAGN